LVREGQLGLATAADERHDAIADREPLYVAAERHDLPCELHPRDVRGAPGRRRVHPASLQHVGAVQAGGAHVDEHLAPARRRVGARPPLEAAGGHGDGPHGRSPYASRGSDLGKQDAKSVRPRERYLPGMPPAESHPPDGSLAVVDDDGNRVVLDAGEAVLLFGLTDGFEAAAVSACPPRRNPGPALGAPLRPLQPRPPTAGPADLTDLAERVPRLHLYGEDLVTDCEHDEGLDRGYTEWCDAIDEVPGVRRPAP